jgi:transcription antitermination protein NusB
MTEPAAEPELSSPREPMAAGKRGLARLAAVQALYQIELTSTDADAVVSEFLAHRLGREIDGDHYAEADRGFFADIVRGCTERREDVDAIVAASLPADWPLARLESVLRAILRAGAYELLARADVPARVAINEYVEIANAFFSGKEPGMVNGVLDGIARALRGAELSGTCRDGGKAR